MAAPTLDSDHPGLRVLAEVVGILASGPPSEDALAAAAGALRRGLGLRRCRVWLRNPDGAGYHPVVAPGDEPTQRDFPPPRPKWSGGGPPRGPTPAGIQLRFPLVHDDEALGLVEVMLSPGRPEGVAHDVTLVVAQILAPVIAATELSQDLASEVALRTREVEAQRNFVARIIDSLPVGLYVIDRSYLIRAWNRKRESGTQGVAQTEKLAAVGQLAAGVMHEINNPLATISACSEALALRIDALAPGDRRATEEYLKIIDTEVQRCRRIVDELLEFSRPKSGQKREVDVNAVLEQTLFLLKHHERFRRMAVARELAEGLPRLPADPERLIQAFMALLLNAMDAMNSRGVLTVRSRLNPERRDELLIEFIDTGVGIPQEELPKIFEPFFTTKPQGRGTGLGRSVCYGIVAEHRGRIRVESQVGVGSNFKVYLPIG